MGAPHQLRRDELPRAVRDEDEPRGVRSEECDEEGGVGLAMRAEEVAQEDDDHVSLTPVHALGRVERSEWVGGGLAGGHGGEALCGGVGGGGLYKCAIQ